MKSKYELIDYNLLYDLYVNKQMSGVKIAKEVGCPNGWVYRCLDYYKIPRRDSSMAAKLSTEDNKRTKLERYGDANYNNMKKHSQTCLEKYGVEHHNQAAQIASKISVTKKTAETQAKYEQTCLERYGVKNINLVPEIRDKAYKTKKKNNSFNSSWWEKDFEKRLLEKYSQEDVFTEYKDDRYRSWTNKKCKCDFYIKSTDTFYELNFHHTHGTHPFNSQNKDDLNLLEELKSQGKEYKIWSESDVAKINSALENGIHMYLIYRTSGKGWENVDIYEIKDHFISALDSSDIQQIY